MEPIIEVERVWGACPQRGLGQSPNLVERVKGIEPSYEAWEASVLPLNYTRAASSIDRPPVPLNPLSSV